MPDIGIPRKVFDLYFLSFAANRMEICLITCLTITAVFGAVELELILVSNHALEFSYFAIYVDLQLN